MMDLCLIFLGCVLVLLVFYLVLELHYFLRSLICVILATCKKRIHILDETMIYGMCLSTDIDNLLNHMNNARFIRELDFAKIDFNIRTGLYRRIRHYGGTILLAATTIRYRRLIKIFHRYYITTKIVYWDEQNIYMEHRFVTPGDNFVNAIVMCKARLTNCKTDEVMKDLLVNKSDCDIEISKREKPALPLELAKWIECNEISSTILRSEVI